MEVKTIGFVLVILLLLLAVWLVWRRRKCVKKIRQMGREEKCAMLSRLAEPFGFDYVPREDIFISRIYAWQRKEGYEALFDRLASKFQMIIDAFPVYFDYQGKTWLIEFWKGQYGINTGAEVGVYHSNRLIPPNQRRQVHYNSVSDTEMPLIGICLERRREKLFSWKEYHWWLAAFRMGLFSQPKDLVLYASVTFHDVAAAEAFCQGLQEAGYDGGEFRIRNRRVTVCLDRTECYAGIARWHRKLAQGLNRFYCRLYRIATAPFTDTVDRMLLLYEQLPGCFRHMLCLHAFGRKVRIRK